MKKLFLGTLPLAWVLLFPPPTMARLAVDIHISLPPTVQFREPPQMIVLPETNVYVVPEAEVDIFFYEGWYWRSWQGGWYRSRNYNSDWSQYKNVPSFYAQIPSDWRNDYRDRRWKGHEWKSQRLSHQQVQQHWDSWERDRYWEKNQTWGVQGLQVTTRSGPDVDISISLPPDIQFGKPPQLIVLPETYVYVVPSVDEDLFFYDGWWWRPWQGGWYRSRNYDSGWGHYRSVPSFYAEIPSGWRNEYRDRRWRGHQWNAQQISYHQVQQNWNGWEKDRHWEQQQNWGVQDLQPQTRPQQSSRDTHSIQYDGSSSQLISPQQLQRYQMEEPQPEKRNKPKKVKHHKEHNKGNNGNGGGKKN